jgi:hypothetical protein
MNGAEFAAEGLIDAVTRHDRGVRVHVVDPGTDAHLDGTATQRLLDGISAAHRDAGAARLWLAGISVGCQAILRCVRARPGLADGLILLTPYLASTGLIAQIGRAGGLTAWAGVAAEDTEEASLLRWLATTPHADLPRILLGRARADRFAATATLLAELVPPEHVASVPGGHDWESWRALWDLLLARSGFVRSPATLP